MLRTALATLFLALPALGMAETVIMTRPDMLRETPSPFSTRLAEVHRRSSVEVREVRGEWLRVEIGGQRNGWIRRDNTDLDSRPSPPSQPLSQSLSQTPAAGRGAPAPLPRSVPRASNHALILDLTPPRNTTDRKRSLDAAAAGRIAALMGVPDANTRYLEVDALDLNGLRQAFVDLDARVGDQDRVLIHIAADGVRLRDAQDCGEGILTGDRQAFPAAELQRYVLTLARRTDKVFLLMDVGRGDDGPPAPGQRNRFSRQKPVAAGCGGEFPGSAPLPGNVQIFLASQRNRPAFEDNEGGLATQALFACLDGQAAVPGDGLADGEALRRCAQGQLDRRRGGQKLVLMGNPALIPAPFSGTPELTGNDAPRHVLEALHAQRDERRKLDVRPVRAVGSGTTFQIAADRPGHLYVLTAGDKKLGLLHPNQFSADIRLEPGAMVSLPPADGRKSLAGARLLFLLTDAPRNPQRGGFLPAGATAATYPDARGLRLAFEEFLGGDPRPACRFGETRNLGAEQARQCSSAFAAKWITVPGGKALDKDIPDR